MKYCIIVMALLYSVNFLAMDRKVKKNLMVQQLITVHGGPLTSDQKDYLSKPLSPAQKGCFEWFHIKHSNSLADAYNTISPEKRSIFTKSSYATNKDQVIKVATKIVKEFCNLVQNVETPLPYNQESIMITILKMKYQNQNKTITDPKDETEVRQFVYQHLLSDQEKETYQEASFKKNKQATYDTMQKMGNLIAQEMVNRKLLIDTPEAKQDKAAAYVTEKKAAFEQWYKN